MTNANQQAEQIIANAAASSKTVVAGTTKNAPGVLKRTSAYQIDARTIVRREGWNPRFDFGDLAGLAQSLVHNGMLNPIRVKRVTPTEQAPRALFELIDGDRRLSAIEMLIKKGKYDEAFPDGIPAVIVEKSQEDLTSLIQMFEANSGKVFLPMEEAHAYNRMQAEGMTIAQISKAVGRANVHIVGMLAVLKADTSVTDAVVDGSIGKTDAKKIATAARGDKAKQAELVKQAQAAKGDKSKRVALKAAVHKQRAAKAASKGKTIKIRALSDIELSQIGSDIAANVVAFLAKAELPADTDMRAWCKLDPELMLAYTYGALSALKVAAGLTNDLDITK